MTPAPQKPKKAPRAAPRERLARAERERQMLEEAARIFGEQGYRNASMVSIAEAVGVTKPMLYAYFGSKEGLYLAVVDQAGQHLVKSMQALLLEPDPAQRLRLGAQYLLGYIARHRDSWGVLFSEAVAGAKVAARVTYYRQQIVDMIAATLAALAPKGRNPEAYALAIIGAGEAITNWWVRQEDASLFAMSTTVGDIVESISNAYVAGAAPRGRSAGSARQASLAK